MTSDEFAPETEAAEFRAASGANPCLRVSIAHRPSGAVFNVDFEIPIRLVGSHADADVALSDSLCEPKRFLLWVRAGRAYAIDLCGEPNRRSFSSAALSETPVTFGDFELATDGAPPPAVELPPPRRGWLLGEPGAWIRMRTSPVLFGGDSRCHVIFHSSRASRVHAAAIRAPGGCWIVDLASRTGTFLNDRPIEFARLLPGDSVRIARSEFVFQGTKALPPAIVAPAAAPPVRSAGGELLLALMRQMVELQAKQTEDSQRIATLLAGLMEAAGKGGAPAARFVASLASTPKALARLPLTPESAPDRPSRTLPALEAAAGAPVDDAEMHDWFQKQFAAIEEVEPSLLERIRGIISPR